MGSITSPSIREAAHAAVLPHMGINALNAFVLFDNAMNM